MLRQLWRGIKQVVCLLDGLIFDNFVARAFGNVPVFVKLWLGFLVLNGFIIGIGFFSVYELNKTAKYISKVYSEPLQSINFSRTAQNDFTQLDFALYRAYRQDALDAEARETIDEGLSTFQDNIAIAKERAIGEYSKDSLEEIQMAMTSWIKVKDGLFEGRTTYESVVPISETIQSNLADLSEFEATAAYDYVIAAEKSAYSIEKQNEFITITAGIVGLLIAYLLGRHILRPIKKSVAISKSIAEGNLENEIVVKRKDELGKLLFSLARMQQNLVENIEAQKEAIHDAQAAEERKKKQMLAELSGSMKQLEKMML